MFASNVAPKRKTRERPQPWRCCNHQLAGYLTRCPTCGTRRHGDHVRVRDAVALGWLT